MKSITYKIELYDYWHIGSGLTGTADTNSVVKRDEKSLPFIPGKTLKGLLSEAANHINRFSDKDYTSLNKKLFGIGADDAKIENAKLSSPEDDKWITSNELEGTGYFSSAHLSQNLGDKILSNTPPLTPMLFSSFSSTSINEYGVAVDETLRTMQVTIPLSLYAKVEDITKDEIELLEKCFKWVKRIGVNRNRGMGRCTFKNINHD